MQSTVINNHVCESCADALHNEVLGTLDGRRLSEPNTAAMIREYGPGLMAHECDFGECVCPVHWCGACQDGSLMNSGIPGILSNGERCDACQRFNSDQAARAYFKERG